MKLVQKENDLQHLLTFRESRGDEGKREWAVSLPIAHRVHANCLQIKLADEGFDNDQDLDDTIKKLEADLKKARKKEAAETDDLVGARILNISHKYFSHKIQEEPSFPLVDVADADVFYSACVDKSHLDKIPVARRGWP